jgi:Protein of unknown function (DUF3616)
MRASACAISMVVVLGTAPCLAADEAKFGDVVTHRGICEPSGVVALPAGTIDQTFIVANDEDNILRAFRPAGGKPVALRKGDLNEFLQLDPTDEDQKADLEGATWLNGRAYWIGSHSRSGGGKLRKPRWQLFATELRIESGTSLLVAPHGKPSTNLLTAISALDPRLQATIELTRPDVDELAPDNGGFNIEGLTVRADGKSMLIGLRSPLFGGNAVLLPLENPEAVVEKGEEPILGRPIEVGLGGRGVRSIEYSEGAKAYFIVAGPAGGGKGSFELFRWPAAENAPPTPVRGFASTLAKKKKLKKFQPEAMVVDATGKKLHLFSDDGDDCKKSNPSFRSVAVTLR